VALSRTECAFLRAKKDEMGWLINQIKGEANVTWIFKKGMKN
jgi:hypothetical protein